MATPKTTKEALIAEMLGDIDAMMQRIEQYPTILKAVETGLLESARTMETAGASIRKAAREYTEQAKESLQNFTAEKAAEIKALRTEPMPTKQAAPQPDVLGLVVKTAVVTSICTAIVTAVMVKLF
jgi:uncharacterized membrane protein YccC